MPQGRGHGYWTKERETRAEGDGLQARGTIRGTIFTALAAALVAGGASGAAAARTGDAEASLFDAEGYRAARYRAPIRLDPAPAQAIDLAEALTLTPGRDALFIDVMPAEGAVRDPASGAWRLAASHLTIPGALWFPETGRAPVDQALWAGLTGAIDEARRARPDLPVILFCRSDCWMSWNAARRLAREGRSGIFWLAEGTDGWHAAGRALIEAAPVITPPSRSHARQKQEEH